ncbi:hypothetical protein BWK69_01280 [Candidatus Parcubacteria bacterium A4]|nr:MAG: hypothetical protein BWK69_01280 [Candidatus Parcubacteria bacterium A4]
MKIDLHCHSKYSYDAGSSVEKLIIQAKKIGLDGIAITDHDNTDGWKDAIELSEKYDFLIILGEEIKTIKGDVIGLFLKEEIKGYKKDPRWVMEQIKKQGGIVLIPHPFHGMEKFKDNLENYLDLIDAIEVFNGREPFSSPDKIARLFAEKHNIAMTGGSDAHYYKPVGDSYTETHANNLEKFKQAILDRKTIANGKKSNIIYSLCPVVEKIKRFFKINS